MTGWFSRLFTRITEAIDQSIGWQRLPVLLGLVILIGLRLRLRARNLYDTSDPSMLPSPSQPATGKASQVSSGQSASTTGIGSPRYLTARTADGTYNDLDNPRMGSVNTRFGRNVPLAYAYPEEPDIFVPNPRAVSRELLTRQTFQPATSINLLVAAWVQFMIHDWFSHGKNQKENPWKVPLSDDDPWPEHPMTILRTHSDPTRTPASEGLPPSLLR